MNNYKQIRLNDNRLAFCTFGFYNHNYKYRNNVLFTFISLNLLILGGPLLDILEKNLSTSLSIKLLFVYIFRFLA
jgi:hypothetical protein